MRTSLRVAARHMPMLAIAAALCASRALAGDGVIEINQDKALAGGVTPGDVPGFPVSLSQAGSYRLTSSLSVPADTTGIAIGAPGVKLDLNGFAVTSSYTCCSPAAGSANGVESNATRTKVVDGEVSGFANRGVSLGAYAHAEGLVVRSVGGHGIALGDGGIALANRVTLAGASGLRFTGTIAGLYRDNVLTRTAQQLGSTAPALSGLAHASGGNSCEDFSCSRRGARRYYLTGSAHDGLEAPSACDAGFHFASLHEVGDFAALEYDATRGQVRADASVPGGPPVRSTIADEILGTGNAGIGWVRTGYASSAGATGANCNAWTTDSNSVSGTVAWLEVSSPTSWTTAAATCDGLDGPRVYGVWCVED